MLPDNELSTRPVAAPFLVPYRLDKLVDYEWGGVDIADTSKGMQVKIWTCRYVGHQVIISDGLISRAVLNVENITALSFAFDLSMQPVVTYVVNAETYLNWYDTAISQRVTTKFGANFITPQLALDDHRAFQSANADVIFAYLRDGILRTRLQRDRYQIEYSYTASQELVQIGMTTNYRFAFASKVINTFSIEYDQARVSARNPADSRLDKLDLCPLLGSYNVSYGDNTLLAEGIEGDQMRSGLENPLNTVPVSFNLKADDYKYFMAFYRVWQYRLKPFLIDLVIDQRPLQTYKVHFVPDSVSMTKQGPVFKVSTQLTVIEERFNKSAIKSLAESRNYI